MDDSETGRCTEKATDASGVQYAAEMHLSYEQGEVESEGSNAPSRFRV
jgi:hypothetical protein